MVTSNHINLLVVDDGERETTPKSIQLIAGRSGQEYNQRKNHKAWVVLGSNDACRLGSDQPNQLNSL